MRRAVNVTKLILDEGDKNLLLTFVRSSQSICPQSICQWVLRTFGRNSAGV